jgi:CheY-like chemotaxis protein
LGVFAVLSLLCAVFCPVLVVLVTDCVMPGMSGREMADVLRARWPHLRTLFLSGYSADLVMRQGGFEAGEAFLQKPFTLAALAEKVREVLDSSVDGRGPLEPGLSGTPSRSISET